MKLTTISALLLAGAAGMGLWSCSADNLGVSEPDNGPALGETVRLTVSVSRDASAATRTEMSEANDGADLACTWSAGDKLLVTDASGVRRGVLEIAGGVDEAEGIFSGDVSIEGLSTEDKTSLNFLYLGTSLNATVSATGDFNGWNDSEKKYTANYTEQNSTLASLTDKDFLTVSENVNLSAKGDGKGEVYVANTLQMVRRISFAKFQLRLPKGVTLGSDAKVTVTGTGLNSLAMASFADNAVKMAYSQALEESADAQSNTGISTSPATRYDVTGGASTSTGGTLLPAPAKPVLVSAAGIEHDKDNNIYSLYMVLLPNGLTGDDAKFDLTFTVKTADGSTYKGTYAVTKGIVEGKYYHKHTVTSDDGTTKSEDIVIDMDDADLVGPVFEVNGKKFRFTRANLMYDVETKKWSLFDNQYDFICKGGWVIKGGSWSKTKEQQIDMFGWGATGLWDVQSGDYARAPEYWREYAKESLSSAHPHYPSCDDKYNSGWQGNYLANGIKYTNFDWGKAYYLSIHNEEVNKNSGKSSYDTALKYFTLSSSDWGSIIGGHFISGCTITDLVNTVNPKAKGVYGCLIFRVSDKASAVNILEGVSENIFISPELTDGLGNNVNYAKFNYDFIKMTVAEFKALEATKEIVFLPEAGHKGSDSMTKDDGYYWTSTIGTNLNATMFRFDGNTNTKIFQTVGSGKSMGGAVRLVKEVEVPAAK